MSAKTVIRADAVVELVLGVVLLVGAATGWLEASDFPDPVTGWVVAFAGVAHILLAGVLWVGWISLSVLAVGNAVAALAGLAWLAVAAGFSSAGAAFIVVAASALLGLAAAQLVTLRA